jgi:hypothetical protein
VRLADDVRIAGRLLELVAAVAAGTVAGDRIRANY